MYCVYISLCIVLYRMICILFIILTFIHVIARLLLCNSTQQSTNTLWGYKRPSSCCERTDKSVLFFMINVESNHPARESVYLENTFIHCTVEGKAQHLLHNNQPNRLKEIEGICFVYMHTSCVYINVYTEWYMYAISSFIHTYTCI